MKTSAKNPSGGNLRQRPRHGPKRRPAAPAGGLAASSPGRVIIYGLHAAEAALLNPARQIRKIWATPNALHRLGEPLARRGVSAESVPPGELDRRLGEGAVHQGVMLEAGPLPPVAVEELASASLVLALDHVTDPHNVGAILRSAAAFGVGGVIMTSRRSPPLSGVLAKAACGGLECVPIALVPNLAQALAKMGELGFWRIGLDSDAESSLEDGSSFERVLLVLGAEDVGLRRLTRERCDAAASLGTASGAPIRSLNVSNAAAIALHHVAWTMRRA
jgi:23S rRNA (guanosine2251-2'-O)-methyltransferase